MLSSLCFSLTRPLTTQVFMGGVTGDKCQWSVMSADVVFHAINYKGMTLVVYRKDIDKSYIFTSNGYDWTPLQS